MGTAHTAHGRIFRNKNLLVDNLGYLYIGNCFLRPVHRPVNITAEKFAQRDAGDVDLRRKTAHLEPPGHSGVDLQKIRHIPFVLELYIARIFQCGPPHDGVRHLQDLRVVLHPLMPRSARLRIACRSAPRQPLRSDTATAS